MNLVSVFGQELVANIGVGVLLYVAGIVTGELWDVINAKRHEEQLKLTTRSAIEAIYEAERKFASQPQSGAEKLDYATKLLMKQVKFRHYKQAQIQIIQVFHLTKLSNG